MPVTTRSQARRTRIHELAQFLASTDFVPVDPGHQLNTDPIYQTWYYSDGFEHDFSEWPKTCWLKPKFETMDFYTTIWLLQFHRLMPDCYLTQNPNKKVDFVFSIEARRGGARKIFTLTIDGNPQPQNAQEYDDFKLCLVNKCNKSVLELYRSPNYLQNYKGFVLMKIVKIQVTQTSTLICEH